MLDIVKQKLEQEGYVLTMESEGQLSYARVTRVGVPPNKGTGQKPEVYVCVDTNTQTVDMTIEAHNGDNWCTASISNCSFAYFAQHLRTLERRVGYAWRELSD